MQANSSTSSSDIKSIFVFLFKFSIFIILLIPVLYAAGKKYAAATTENLINDYNKKRFEDFYSLEKNSLDVVFLGSSHSYCTFDPEIFDEASGMLSFQIGMPMQHPDSTYFTLLEVLRYQSPKLAIIELYWDMLDDSFEMKQAAMLFQVLKNEQLEKQYIKEVFPVGEKIKYSINIARHQADYFAYKNNELKKRIENRLDVHTPAAKKQEGIEQYGKRGFIYCDYQMLPDEFDRTNQFVNFNGRNWKFDKKQRYYLQKIADTCKQHGIAAVFVTAPVANVSMEKIGYYDYVSKTVSEFAEKNNVPYIDYNIINAKDNLLTNENFRDDAHLNYSGAKIVNSHFINWLIEKGVMKDAFR